MRVAHARSITAIATDSQSISSTSTSISITVANATTQVYYIHTDQLNTPRLITNQANAKVWEWNNDDPFANNAPNDDPNNTGNHFEFNHRFAGQYADKETNTHYNYFRDYDAQSGRYIESDPIGLGGGINTYGYVGGDPLSEVDPRGLADVTNSSSVPIVVGGRPGSGYGHDHNANGNDYPHESVSLPPGGRINEDNPIELPSGRQLRDVDSTDRNGDGIAAEPRDKRDFFPPPIGNGEKIPGGSTCPKLIIVDDKNCKGKVVYKWDFSCIKPLARDKYSYR